jgi:alanyl-tRNA synthetase
LKAPRDELVTRISTLSADLRAAEKKIAAYEATALSARVPTLVSAARPFGDITVVAESVGELRSSDDLRMLVTSVRERLGSAASVVALAADVAGKPVVIVATNDEARKASLRAGALAKIAASILGGGGGGKDDLAQGGGTNVSAIEDALAGIRSAIAGAK